MSNSERKKINDSKAWTKAGKAQDLLKKYKLWGEQEVKATPINLKVLFGKNGVVRLLRDSKVTNDKKSVFNRMAEGMLSYYIKLKLESLQLESQEAISKRNDLLAEFSKYLAETCATLDNLTEQSMANKIGVRETEAEIGHKENRASHLEHMVRSDQRKARDLYRNAGRGNVRHSSMPKGYVVDKGKRLSYYEALDKANIYRIQADGLRRGPLKGFKDGEEVCRMIISEIDKYVAAMKKLIKENKIADRKFEDGMKEFCEFCNKQGAEYYNRKQTNVLSLRTNKVKKETARILSILTPPPASDDNN